MGLQLAGALGRFWHARGYVTEGREWLSAVLALPGTADYPVDRGRALYAAATLAFIQCDFEVVRAFYEEILTISREQENKQGIAAALNGLGNVGYRQGDYASAGRFYEESLTIRRELGNKHDVAYSLNNLGSVAQHQGDYERARALLEESLATLRELGDMTGVTAVLNNLGDVAFAQGDHAAAGRFYEGSLGIERELKNKEGIAFELGNVGKVALRLGDYSRARELMDESLVLRTELGDKVGVVKCLVGIAEAERIQKRPERGAQLLGAASALLESAGAQLNPTDRTEYEGYVALLREQLSPESFAALWRQGEAMSIEQATDFALLDSTPQWSAAAS
jgi:tetratricopeptide (TPR) repeat protein